MEKRGAKYHRERLGEALREEIETIVEGELGDPPDLMSDSQKAVWRELIEVAPPGLLKKSDVGIAKVWVIACDTFNRASAKLVKTNMLYVPPNSPVPIQSPYLTIINKQGD